MQSYFLGIPLAKASEEFGARTLVSWILDPSLIDWRLVDAFEARMNIVFPWSHMRGREAHYVS